MTTRAVLRQSRCVSPGSRAERRMVMLARGAIQRRPGSVRSWVSLSAGLIILGCTGSPDVVAVGRIVDGAGQAGSGFNGSGGEPRGGRAGAESVGGASSGVCSERSPRHHTDGHPSAR